MGARQIAEFGGIPDNVTIFGHSGGGLKVAGLMAMPAAEGLFHRAILQSGFGTATVAPAEGERITAALRKALNITPGDVSALRDVPVDRLLAALQICNGRAPDARPRACSRRHVLSQTSSSAAATLPAFSNVPVMVGHTSAETQSPAPACAVVSTPTRQNLWCTASASVRQRR